MVLRAGATPFMPGASSHALGNNYGLHPAAETFYPSTVAGGSSSSSSEPYVSSRAEAGAYLGNPSYDSAGGGLDRLVPGCAQARYLL